MTEIKEVNSHWITPIKMIIEPIKASSPRNDITGAGLGIILTVQCT